MERPVIEQKIFVSSHMVLSTQKLTTCDKVKVDRPRY